MGAPAFHAGEQAVQARVHVAERMGQVGPRVIRDFMPDEHRKLFEQLPFLVAGSADADGRVWASLLVGEPGFVRSPTATLLTVDAQPLPGDALAQSLRVAAPLGLLGIELPTRRRNRANGHVALVHAGGFGVHVQQSFGNCSKYIQARSGPFLWPAGDGKPSAEHARLSWAARELLAGVDTAFIATSSANPTLGGAEGLDVSHRGGHPGFIRVAARGDATLLTLPDFSGNFMFTSLGNLQQNPRAGLLAVDFDSGNLLAISGTAQVVWDGPELPTFVGAERLVEFRVERGLLWRSSQALLRQ